MTAADTEVGAAEESEPVAHAHAEPAAGPGVAAPSPRRFAIGCAVGGAIAVAAFFWMVTNGTGQLFQPGLNADFYDAQARALLAGHWWIPANVLSIEGIVEHGRTYMYYGPFPAVLRMPILLATHSLDGKLTGLSMLVAFGVAVLFVSRLSWKIRLLVEDSAEVTRTEAAIAGVLVLLLTGGGALFFLASNAIVYHEAELWGAALALGAFDFLLRFLRRPRPVTAIAAGTFAALAMLTRGSVGAGPVVALGLTLLVALAVTIRRDRVTASFAKVTGLDDPPAGWPIVAVLAACVLVPIAAYAAVNEAKFGSLFNLPLDHQVETIISPHRRSVLAANGGSLFGLKFVPTALFAYLRPDRLTITRLFPFVMFPDAAPVIGHLKYDDRDWASSIPATMPLVTLLAILGAVGMLWPRPQRRHGRRRHATRRLRIPVMGALAGTTGVLEIAFIANRYLSDFMPLVVLLSLAGAHLVIGRARRTTSRRAIMALAGSLCGLIALAGLWSNTGLTLVYQRELRPGIPLSERAGLVDFQQHLDASWFGGRPEHVEHVRTLRLHAPAGTLAIIGHCSGLYESAGVQSGWDAVERGSAGGHVRFHERFPPAPAGASAAHPGRWWPVLTNGLPRQADWLALRSLGGDTYQFGYLFEGKGQRFLLGPPFTERAGTSHVVDAVFDPNVAEVTADVDATVQFELGYLVRGNRPYYVASNPLGGPVAARLPGFGGRVPVSTPVCHFIEQRLKGR